MVPAQDIQVKTIKTFTISPRCGIPDSMAIATIAEVVFAAMTTDASQSESVVLLIQLSRGRWQ
jgi:mannose/fructose/N-acetylgalactosamine-specific phosphotransferase system component IID